MKQSVTHEEAVALLDALLSDPMQKFAAGERSKLESDTTAGSSRHTLSREDLAAHGVGTPEGAKISVGPVSNGGVHPMGSWSICGNLGPISICYNF